MTTTGTSPPQVKHDSDGDKYTSISNNEEKDDVENDKDIVVHSRNKLRINKASNAQSSPSGAEVVSK